MDTKGARPGFSGSTVLCRLDDSQGSMEIVWQKAYEEEQRGK